MSAAAPAQHWQRSTPTFIAGLPVLDFPFETPPDIFAAESTVLRGEDGALVYAFMWCFLRRKVKGAHSAFDASSLSETRLRTMPTVLKRLSKWFRFRNARPRSVRRVLNSLGLFLSWVDSSPNSGRYEAVLSDSALALDALRGYHSYLRSRLQSHQISPNTAGYQDQDAIACLSEIHDRVFKDDIEPLSSPKGKGTDAPDTQVVQSFGSTLQAVFDSASALALGEAVQSAPWALRHAQTLRVSATDDSKVVSLEKG